MTWSSDEGRPGTHADQGHDVTPGMQTRDTATQGGAGRAHCVEREVPQKCWHFTDSKESIWGRKGYQDIKCLRVYKYSDNIVTLGRVLTTQNKWNLSSVLRISGK